MRLSGFIFNAGLQTVPQSAAMTQAFTQQGQVLAELLRRGA